MTNPDLTHLYFLLDRSGSMQSIKTDTEGGFDAFIAEQRNHPGDCRVTLAQFDDRYEEVYVDRSLADVPPLQLSPRGSTALLDAIGRLITDAGARLARLREEQRPGTVIVGIMTDGYENASREWTHPAVKALIEQQTTIYSWDFLYLGADQDAIEVGTSLGVAANKSVTYSRGYAREVLRSTAAMTGRIRQAKSRGAATESVGFTDRERAESGGGETHP